MIAVRGDGKGSIILDFVGDVGVSGEFDEVRRKKITEISPEVIRFDAALSGVPIRRRKMGCYVSVLLKFTKL